MSEWNVTTKPKSLVREHIDRCIELYAQPIDENEWKKPASRESYEQLRADLMLAIGMLAAMEQPASREPA